MGQKVNPHGLRVGVIKDWDSKWYADKKDFHENPKMWSKVLWTDESKFVIGIIWIMRSTKGNQVLKL